MSSVQLLDSCLNMLKKHGYWPTDISVSGENITISGLEVLPPTPQEEALEASDHRRQLELSKDNLRVLGIDGFGNYEDHR